jgi:hypothetical protein
VLAVGVRSNSSAAAEGFPDSSDDDETASEASSDWPLEAYGPLRRDINPRILEMDLVEDDSKLSAHETAISDLKVNFPTAFQSVSLPSPIPKRPVDWTIRGDDRVPSEDLVPPPKRVRFARTPILKYPDDFLHPSISRHTAPDHRHASEGTSASEYIDACLRLDYSRHR